MVSLYLSDILKRNDIDPKRCKLVRHSLNHKRCKICYENDFIDHYQKIQSKNFYGNCDVVLSFINEPGTSAKFIGCYKVGEGKLINKTLMPEGFPAPEMFSEDKYYFDLQPSELMSDLKNRLIIDWGKAAVSWYQWATNEKLVLAIQANPKYIFQGYDKIVLSFAELKEIIDDKTLYENWHLALSSVYAIYLIVDTKDGKQYVGSAYGQGGLLSRWACYIATKDGDNKQMKELICYMPDRFEYFQFSILQILPKTIAPEEVITIENLYKKKLQSKEFGLN
jgi:hypothetical protein